MLIRTTVLLALSIFLFRKKIGAEFFRLVLYFEKFNCFIIIRLCLCHFDICLAKRLELIRKVLLKNQALTFWLKDMLMSR